MIDIPNNIKLIAVTKGKSIFEINEAISKYNLKFIGESKWQEAKEKIQHLSTNIEKHFIGHIQTNKAKYIVKEFDYIQSVDSVKLAKVINKEAVKINKTVPVLLQINISNDMQKYGFLVSEISDTYQELTQLENINVQGFMAITAKQDISSTREDFKKMKELQNKYSLPELSIGMSNDYQIAIEEGATMVRIGAKLFTDIVS